MRIRIKNQQDFWAGLMFIAFGIAAIAISRDYPYGTAMRMGPGYFPTWIGAMLIILGTAVSAVSFKLDEDRLTPVAWKPMILLSLAFVVFGFGIDHAGFVPALVGVIVLSAAAGKRFHPLEVLLLTVVLVLIELGIFVYGIELPLRLFWWD